MATKPLPRRTADRRTWARPAPTHRRRRPWRALRRLLVLAAILGALFGAGWLYVLHVYAPGLRTEVRNIPALVHKQLAVHSAPYAAGPALGRDLRHAIVAVEDRRFYSHPGIDPLAMARALLVNLSRQHVDQGGSTLEQQLVKRTLVPDDYTVRGKVRETALAWAVDQEFDKQTILELYLNAAYYGQGAYGAAQAAHVYFGTDAAHLTLPQAAFLAALPQAPSVYGANPSGPVIQARRERVLQDMEQSRYITPAQLQAALAVHLTFALPNP